MAKRRLRANRRQLAYRQLNTAFPHAFPLDDDLIRPLALSTREDLTAWIKCQAIDDRMARALLRVLQHHCYRRTYQQVVANGGMRINLQGEPVEPVTPEGQALAEQRLTAIRAARAETEQPLATRPARVPKSSVADPPPKASGKPRVTPTPPPAPSPPQAMPAVIIKKRRRIVRPD